MCIPRKHPVILVAADERHLWDAEAHLKEPGDGLVPKVVEVKVGDAGAFDQALPSEGKGNGG